MWHLTLLVALDAARCLWRWTIVLVARCSWRCTVLVALDAARGAGRLFSWRAGRCNAALQHTGICCSLAAATCVVASPSAVSCAKYCCAATASTVELVVDCYCQRHEPHDMMRKEMNKIFEYY
jgi:hypothetical protein